MTKIITGFILISLLLASLRVQAQHCDIDSLNARFVTMKQKDQDIRKELMKAVSQYQKDGSGQMNLLTLSGKMKAQDQQNQKELLGIFEGCSWPEALNEDSHSTIYLILQHSPDALMREHYPTVEAYAQKGLLAPDDAATMYDRLQMNAGLPQRYGTQTFSDSQNRNQVWPVEDVEKLEDLRKSVGLPTMEAYFQIARDSFKVEMVWDKTLTLEKAKKMK